MKGRPADGNDRVGAVRGEVAGNSATTSQIDRGKVEEKMMKKGTNLHSLSTQEETLEKQQSTFELGKSKRKFIFLQQQVAIYLSIYLWHSIYLPKDVLQLLLLLLLPALLSTRVGVCCFTIC